MLHRLVASTFIALLVLGVFRPNTCHAIDDLNQLLTKMRLDVGVEGELWALGPPGHVAAGSTVHTYNGNASNPGIWDVAWDFKTANINGYEGTYHLTNTTDQIQTFVINLSRDSNVTRSPKTAKGWMRASVRDQNGDGYARAKAVAETPLFTGRYDDLDVLHIFNDPFEISTSVPGARAISPLVNGSMFTGYRPEDSEYLRLTHTFSLTPGDTATIESKIWVVKVVPEPSSSIVTLYLSTLLASRTNRRK